MKDIRVIIAAVLLAAFFIGYIIWNQASKQQFQSPQLGSATNVVPSLKIENIPVDLSLSSSIQAPSEIVRPTNNIDSVKRTLETQHFEIRRGLRRYAKPIEAMKLSPENEKKLWDLLFKRSEAGYIAQEVHQQKKAERKPSNLSETLVIARSEVDAEILETFGEDLSKQIASMIDAARAFDMVSAYDGAFDQIGEPITPEQSLPVALIFKENYGETTRPDQIPTKELIDPGTGLIPTDNRIIVRLAEVLSARQLEAFKKELAKRNLAYASKHQIEPPFNPL